MVQLKINFQKKDLLLIAAVMVFIIAVGYVIAYNYAYPGGSASPIIHGHTPDEIYNLSSGGGSCSFGDWESKNINTQYTASTDGLVSTFCPASSSANGVTPDGGQPKVGCEGSGTQADGFTMPVKKGDTWKVYPTSGTGQQAYWIPLNCGGSGVKVETGTVNDGQTIPLPSGYTQDKCKWFVSPGSNWGQGGLQMQRFTCTADANRVVTARSWTDINDKAETASYMIICGTS